LKETGPRPPDPELVRLLSAQKWLLIVFKRNGGEMVVPNRGARGHVMESANGGRSEDSAATPVTKDTEAVEASTGAAKQAAACGCWRWRGGGSASGRAIESVRAVLLDGGRSRCSWITNGGPAGHPTGHSSATSTSPTAGLPGQIRDVSSIVRRSKFEYGVGLTFSIKQSYVSRPMDTRGLVTIGGRKRSTFGTGGNLPTTMNPTSPA